MGESLESYPVNEYYLDHIVNAKTIKKTAKSWVAVLVISDPRSGTPFLRIYEWKLNKSGEWKRHGVISLAKSSEIRDLMSTLDEFSHPVADGEVSKMKKKIKRRSQ